MTGAGIAVLAGVAGALACRAALATGELPWDLLPDRPAEIRAEAFERVEREPEPRWLAPLVDLLRFADSPEEWYRILDAAGAVLGRSLRDVERPWRTLSLRLAEDPPPLPADYAAWKGRLLALQVDPRFEELLHAEVDARVRLDEVVWGGVAVDEIPALDRPAVLAAAEGDQLLEDAEPVFGVSLGGEHRAYPLRVLDWHEMANDVVGGEPVALAWCTLCGAGVLYRTRVAETTHVFGTSGLLLRSNKLMFDRGTKTLWNQLTGEPVIGPLARSGIRLETLPLVVTSWGAWRARHPDTTVLSPETGHARDYTPGAAYGEYFASSETMFPAAPRGAPRFEAKERVFVLRLGSRAEAFALDDLRRRGVANERVGDRAVVLVTPDAAPDRELPPALVSGLQRLGAAAIGRASELDPETAAALLDGSPALAAELDAELLLALPAATRLALLERHAELGLPRALRDAVAQRGLVGETRAFERGERAFRASGEPDVLLDAGGGRWSVTETALVGPAGERLARLPGHLAFGFAWDAFFGAGAR